MLRGLLGVSEKMTSEQIEARIRDGLAALSIDVDATLPYVLNLLGQRIDKRDGLISSSTGPAESAGVRTRRALRDIIDRQCPRTRVALIIEDLHWIDTASEEILQAICTSTKSGHLFIVTSYRPTYTPRWVGAPDVTDLQLARLTTDEVVGLMSARLATNKLQEGLVQLVVGKSDGNPLFAEELISYLLHRQMIVSTPDGIRLADTVDSAGLPASLENLLMERVDQLDENPRAVIRTASVVGRRFASSVVQEAGALNGSFLHDLAVLETMELVFPEAESTYSDYIFKHALVQDAIYRTLMRSDREKLHRRVGEVIEKRYADTVDEISDVLVHHFEQGRLGNKAVRYMALAGHRALALLSLDEAELRLRQVIEIVEQDPDAVDDEIFAEVLIDMLHLTCWRYNFAEMLTLSQRHLPRIERFGESRQLSRVLQWAGEALICAARFDEAAEVLGRSLAIGEKLDNKECTMFALWDLMWLFSVRPDGQPNDYIEKTGQRVLALAHELDDYYHEALARYLLSADCLQRGHLAEAEKWAQESIEFGHETGYAPAISLGLMFAALCDAMRGCLERALERADEAVARCAGETERAIALGAKGVVLALSGQFDEAVQNLAYVRQVAHDQTFQVLLTYVEIPHGIARVFAGDQGGGIADLTRAIDLFSQWKNARMVAWAHLSLGQIYLHSATSEESPPSEGLQLAKRHLEEAVQIGQSAGTDGNVAEAMFNLGLLAKSMNQIGSAQVHLDEALRVAEPLSWPELVGKIETARAEL
jgi:tetratricopeptide (TPR) repeat protein